MFTFRWWKGGVLPNQASFYYLVNMRQICIQQRFNFPMLSSIGLTKHHTHTHLRHFPSRRVKRSCGEGRERGGGGSCLPEGTTKQYLLGCLRFEKLSWSNNILGVRKGSSSICVVNVQKIYYYNALYQQDGRELLKPRKLYTFLGMGCEKRSCSKEESLHLDVNISTKNLGSIVCCYHYAVRVSDRDGQRSSVI